MPACASTRRLGWFAAAAVPGLVHAAASLYWAAGGFWLLDTVGAWAVQLQEHGDPSTRIMLAAVGMAKAAGAVVPYLDHRRDRSHRWVRAVSWLGAGVLVVWGLFGAVGGWIGLLRTAPGAAGDRVALWGHAALWDPLFVLWGFCLGVALIRSRPSTGGADGPGGHRR